MLLQEAHKQRGKFLPSQQPRLDALLRFAQEERLARQQVPLKHLWQPASQYQLACSPHLEISNLEIQVFSLSKMSQGAWHLCSELLRLLVLFTLHSTFA